VKIYTKRGDGGETDLFGGERVAKDSSRVEAYGTVDELNSFVGVAAAASSQTDLVELLQRIQGTLFAVGASLATPGADRRAGGAPGAMPGEIGEPEVAELERAIDRLEGELEPLRHFVIPGGAPSAVAFQVARSVCRRAERSVVRLDVGEPLGGGVVRYLNRLSDLLFVMARVENRRAGVEETVWDEGS
jgi:cob(I)alamin adenosyltransferase